MPFSLLARGARRLVPLLVAIAAAGGALTPGLAGQALASPGAVRQVQAPPYDAAAGAKIVATADQVVLGDWPWTRGCVSGVKCVPYSWGAGHGALPGPSQGQCRDGWHAPKGAPAGLLNGPDCYHDGNKNHAANGTFGLDCSGFTRWVYYLVYGKDVLGSGAAGSQPHRAGVERVPAADRKPGDLVTFPGHVGIFAGTDHGRPVILNEPHSYDVRSGTNGKSITDYVTAYGRQSALSAKSKKIRYWRYTGKPAGEASELNTGGAGYGAVLGPDHNIWLVDTQAADEAGGVERVNPATLARKTFKPKVSAGISVFASAPAFDGRGRMWLAATTQASAGFAEELVRYTRSSGHWDQFKLPRGCQDVAGLYGSPDGYVWALCDIADSTDTKLVRISDDGKFLTASALAQAPALGPLTAGADGDMWAVSFSAGFSDGIVRITPGGGETFFADTNGVGAIGIAGNGKGALYESGTCPGKITVFCVESVSASGDRSILAQYPDEDVFVPAVVDGDGNLWTQVDGTDGGAVSTGQYFFVVGSSAGTVFPFKVPGAEPDVSLEPAIGVPPIFDAGVIWMEELSPQCGSLLRVDVQRITPKGTGGAVPAAASSGNTPAIPCF